MSETKASDLVERLHHRNARLELGDNLCSEAAREIESLRAQLAAAEAELKVTGKLCDMAQTRAEETIAHLQVVTKALDDEIARLENGEDHDEGAFDRDCEICRSLEILRGVRAAINGADK